MKNKKSYWYKGKEYNKEGIKLIVKCEEILDKMTEAQLKDFYIRYK